MIVKSHNKFLLILLSITFFVRLLWSLYNPFLSFDSFEYLTIAKNLIEQGIFSINDNFPYNPTNWRSPIYPFIIAICLKLYNSNLVIYIVQSFISTLTISLIYLIARKIYNTKTALLAVALNCFFLPGIVLSGTVLAETIYSFLIIFGILLAYYPKNGSKFFVIISGLSFGLAALTRPEGLLFPIFYAFILCYVMGHIKKNVAVLIITISLLIPSLWAYRNYKQLCEFSVNFSANPYFCLIDSLGYPSGENHERFKIGYYNLKYNRTQNNLNEYKRDVLISYFSYVRYHLISSIKVKTKKILQFWMYGGSFEKWNWKKDNPSVFTLFNNKNWEEFLIRIGTYLLFGIFPIFIIILGIIKIKNEPIDVAIIFSYPIYITLIFLVLNPEFRYGLPGQMILSIFIAESCFKYFGDIFNKVSIDNNRLNNIKIK